MSVIQVSMGNKSLISQWKREVQQFQDYYVRYPNDTLAYYSFYENGIPHGVIVEFYRNGNLKEYKYMEKGAIMGEALCGLKVGQ